MESGRIATWLRTAILEDELTPGTRIRQEEIATRLGVSRIPVREALRMLDAEGLVRIVSNSGAWVSRLDQRECSEAYRMRERLEPLLLRASLERLTDDDIDRLGEIAATIEQTDSVDEFMRLDRQFHLDGYAAAPPSYLGEVVLRLWNTTHHYRRAFSQLTAAPTLPATRDEHRLLLDGIRRRDPADAERILVMHIRRTRKELERHPEIFA
ncbi:GntR family transcriptional regulator [Microbacterium kribbense]|uniref:GntR family transcriptional regulator n=1 Tax=Microbacterium kribbense TaxID=433645 RepID=UPI0031D37993